jgi:sugar (pentulose or hexulose) kinase
MRRVGIEEEITFTGGVTRNPAMVEVLNEMLGTKMNVSEESHYMGALGAALLALEHVAGGTARGGPAAGGASAVHATAREAATETEEVA